MDRYHTEAMDSIWGERHRNARERHLWVEVMRLQAQTGVQIPQEAIDDYEAVADDPDRDELDQIRELERTLKHDVYARLMYFNRRAGHEYAHWGMTSADVIENVQQAQTIAAAKAIADHAAQVAYRLLELAEHEAARQMVGRTHGRPAQITTLGKRAGDWAVELCYARATLLSAIDHYMPRGLKGAVGTRADMAALLYRHRPDQEAIPVAESMDAYFTADEGLISTGQCYPRANDLPLVSAVFQVAAACDTVATNVRLWAVLGHANECRGEDQVGSSAMPHKSNPRYSERVCGLRVVAQGYTSMLQQIAGGMWFEGDVWTSSVRRVALPGLFHTVDSMLANVAYVLDRLQFDREEIAADVRRWRPMLATGQILEACVAAGVDRSVAHERLRRHADNAMMGASMAFTGLLADDPEIPLSYTQVEELVARACDIEPAEYIARGVAQARLSLDVELDEQWPGELV